MTDSTSPFALQDSFEPGEVAAGVRLGRLEAQYEELFSEVIEDGIITPEERAQLERAAESLGLDRDRLHQLERALTAAYETRRRVRVREIAPAEVAASEAAKTAPAGEPSAADARVEVLTRYIQTLEARITELENELEDLRARTATDVDLRGSLPSIAGGTEADNPEELLQRLRPDPRDTDLLRALHRAFVKRGEADRAFCTAHALVYLGTPDQEIRDVYARHRGEGLVRPSAALSREAWHRLLVHPDQEPLVGEIFAAVLGPVLLGRIAAHRRDGTLPRLDPAQRHDASTSTVSAVRSFGWAAAILGVQLPPLFADPAATEAARMIPGTTPAVRLGKPALSGRTPAELAFLAGEHLAYFRDDAFMRALFDGIPELEDVFLAALFIGNPNIPLTPPVRARVTPLSQAIEPLLDAVQIDRLRGAFLRFVEQGGRTNLQRWASAIDATAARAGLLLANDLVAADTVLRLEDPSHVDERINDLLLFTVGDRYAKLRKQIGIAVA
ncbi:TPR domain protein [Minicystis rosea]|nr:TPR domain protein [Minicystis rosea]